MSSQWNARLLGPRILGLGACIVSAALLMGALAGGSGLVIPAQAQGAGVPKASGAAAPKVSGAWLRLPAVAGRPAAGFFEVAATPGDALTGVASPRAGRVEMHSMTDVDGVMRMRAEPRFAVPDSGTLAFAPGGSHLMLFDLAPGVKAGDRVPLELSFASGARVTVSAEAKPAGTTHRH